MFQDCGQLRFAIEIVRVRDCFRFGKTSSFNNWVHRRNLVLRETKKQAKTTVPTELYQICYTKMQKFPSKNAKKLDYMDITGGGWTYNIGWKGTHIAGNDVREVGSLSFWIELLSWCLNGAPWPPRCLSQVAELYADAGFCAGEVEGLQQKPVRFCKKYCCCLQNVANVVGAWSKYIPTVGYC